MIRMLDEIAALARKLVPEHAAKHCAWLHGAGYNGLKYLAEAIDDEVKTIHLEPDLMGLNLHSVSCVFIAPEIEKLRSTQGRVFLRNVRHGLFLLPNSVLENYGIGCPVDPNFALGGERTKNPYAEKLAIAATEGVEVDDALWQSLQNRT
jgi:hypothetical protein